MKPRSGYIYSQRQLRVGELVKQSLGQIFLREEAKLPSLNTKSITIEEKETACFLSLGTCLEFFDIFLYIKIPF